MYRSACVSLYRSTNACNRARDLKLNLPKCRDGVSASGLTARVFGTSGWCLCEQKKDGGGEVELQVESRMKHEHENLRDTRKLESRAENTADLRSARVEREEEKRVKVEEKVVEEKRVKVEEREEEKKGKQGLLELLGAMKVDTTTRLKSLRKVPSGPENPVKVKRVVMESTSSMFQQASAPHAESLSAEMVAAVSAAASTLPDGSRAESELLRQLRKHEAVSEEERRAETQNIGNIIADMKVGKKPGGRLNSWPANQIRFDDDGRGYTHDRGITGELEEIRHRNSAFTSKKLNIFSAGDSHDSQTTPGPSLWDAELANQIAGAVNVRARNGFEEMIAWTREGKLWQYPINNHTGMEEEAKVPFHEHVFLERHLEDGFPRHGPVRHFMELVVTGLSKNHQLTVTQKLEHLAWFRNYFQEKQEVLDQAEA